MRWLLALLVACSKPTPSITIAVDLTYPGASPEVIEREVIEPIERGLATLSSSLHARADTGEGRVEIELPPDRAMDKVREVLTALRPELPADASVSVSSRSEPTIWLELELDTPALRADIARNVVAPRLESARGVARVELYGVPTTRIEIQPDPSKLASYGLTLSDLVRAVRALDLTLPAGRLQAQAVESIELHTRHDPSALGELLVREHIRVKDLATIREQRDHTASRAIIGVALQHGASAREAREAIAALKSSLPAGARLVDSKRPPEAPRPRAPLVVEVRGPDLAQLATITADLAKQLRAAGTSDIVVEPGPLVPATTLAPNLQRMGDLGVAASEVGAALQARTGVEVSTLSTDGRSIPIVVRAPESLDQLFVRGANELVPLATIVEQTIADQPAAILHCDRQRCATIAIYTNVDAARSLLAKRTLPDGYYLRIGSR